jgi:toxin ParE1/3/4
MAASSVRFEVFLTKGAEQDLEAMHDYISEYDSVAKANRLLDELMNLVDSLSSTPERESHPKELLSFWITEYR